MRGNAMASAGVILRSSIATSCTSTAEMIFGPPAAPMAMFDATDRLVGNATDDYAACIIITFDGKDCVVTARRAVIAF
jgi:hypothetical protein